MELLLRTIIEKIVDEPEKISIKLIEGEKIIILELQVAESDVGKVIGRHGKTINAIRTVLRASSIKSDKKIMLELLQ